MHAVQAVVLAGEHSLLHGPSGRQRLLVIVIVDGRGVVVAVVVVVHQRGQGMTLLPLCERPPGCGHWSWSTRVQGERVCDQTVIMNGK